MQIIKSSRSYAFAEDFWIITSYFNPEKYKTKLENYRIFIEKIRDAGLNWLTVECLFDGFSSCLDYSPNTIQVRGKNAMWQKERLLNIAISKLPSSCKKVAWLDCDIIFENRDWAVQASELLDKYPVVQLFKNAYRLPQGQTFYCGEGLDYESFGSVYLREPNKLLQGNFEEHGHTGFAWAARKDILMRHGLYDACIAGSGDHWMAHAFCGDWESPCIYRIFGGNVNHILHAKNWAKRVYADIRAKVGFVDGSILHLWHGNKENRKYALRNYSLAKFKFDPSIDLKQGQDGCWEWGSSKIELHEWIADYFAVRREDG